MCAVPSGRKCRCCIPHALSNPSFLSGRFFLRMSRLKYGFKSPPDAYQRLQRCIIRFILLRNAKAPVIHAPLFVRVIGILLVCALRYRIVFSSNVRDGRNSTRRSPYPFDEGSLPSLPLKSTSPDSARGQVASATCASLRLDARDALSCEMEVRTALPDCAPSLHPSPPLRRKGWYSNEPRTCACNPSICREARSCS